MEQLNPNIVAVTILILTALALGAGMLIFKSFLGPKKMNASKAQPFECGIEPTGSARNRISSRFYPVAILFVIFDIEIIFLYPWAVKFHDLGATGFWQVVVFLAILMIGLIYILKKGVLTWK